MKQVLLGALAALFLSACASSPSALVRSAWYLQHPSAASEQREAPELYLALLNAGRAPLDVQTVKINGSDARAQEGWTWRAPSGKSPALMLEPGRLVILPASEFWRGRGEYLESFDQACQLPVEVSLWLDVGPIGQEMLRAELRGQMPSTLPAGWSEACRPPAS